MATLSAASPSVAADSRADGEREREDMEGAMYWIMARDGLNDPPVCKHSIQLHPAHALKHANALLGTEYKGGSYCRGMEEKTEGTW